MKSRHLAYHWIGTSAAMIAGSTEAPATQCQQSRALTHQVKVGRPRSAYMCHPLIDYNAEYGYLRYRRYDTRKRFRCATGSPSSCAAWH
jgi:hypothetical protein